MARPFPLQTLLDLAQVNSDMAAAQLCAINGQDREMEQRLQLLLDYRSEYTAHLTQAAKIGMNSPASTRFFSTTAGRPALAARTVGVSELNGTEAFRSRCRLSTPTTR